MITGLAHTALCVADVDAAVEWYRDVLGMTVLSPPFRIDGPDIERDMGELVPSPVVVQAAIIGVPDDGDRVGTTWFADPWDNTFILVEKVRKPDQPYYKQY